MAAGLSPAGRASELRLTFCGKLAVNHLLLLLILEPVFDLGWPLTESHQLTVTRPVDTALFRLTECIRVEVVAVLRFRLVLFYRYAILVGPAVLTNTSNLPRDLDVCRAGLDNKTIVLDLLRDDRLSKLAYDGELIAEVSVQCLEPIGKRDDGVAIAVRCDIAVVNVHHVR